MTRRRHITSHNRSRQRQKEWAMFQTNGESIGSVGRQVVSKVTLQAISPEGKTFLARYGKTRAGYWKILRADPELNFLRFCGRPQDSRRALATRGFSPRWLTPA